MTSTTQLVPNLAGNESFSPDSKIWIYVAAQRLSEEQRNWLLAQLQEFTSGWTAHNQALKATAEIFENQFIILMVDETMSHAGGCSIDKSVRFLETCGDELGVNLIDRMQFGWVQDGALHTGDRSAFTIAVANGSISDETLVLNTLVLSRSAMLEKWLLPYKQSWHRRL